MVRARVVLILGGLVASEALQAQALGSSCQLPAKAIPVEVASSKSTIPDIPIEGASEPTSAKSAQPMIERAPAAAGTTMSSHVEVAPGRSGSTSGLTASSLTVEQSSRPIANTNSRC